MLRKLTYITLLMLVSIPVNAQERFLQFLPGFTNTRIIEKTDHYLSFGIDVDVAYSDNHILFAQLSMDGSTITDWTHDVDTLWAWSIRSHQGISDKGNYIAGLAVGHNNQIRYGILTRFNQDYSDTLYSKLYLMDNATMILSMKVINDTSLVLLGHNLLPNNNVYASLLMTDTLGNIRWQQNYHCSTPGMCYFYVEHLAQASDGGYFISAREDIETYGGQDEYYYVIIKTDSAGNEQWRQNVGNLTELNNPGEITPLDNGNYLVSWGQYGLFGLGAVNNNASINLGEIDLNGNWHWSTTYKDSVAQCDSLMFTYYNVTKAIKTSSGDIVMTLATESNLSYLCSFKQNGTPNWYRRIKLLENINNDAAMTWTNLYDIEETTDGGFICSGEFYSTPSIMFPNSFQSAFALKLDQYGCLEPGCQQSCENQPTPLTGTDLSIYPNPTTDRLFINTPLYEGMSYKVFNAMGQLMDAQQLLQNNTPIEVASWAKGLYTVHIHKNNAIIYSSKIIKI